MSIKKDQGDVSLFVVIFAALLFTIVALSFVRIMLRGQLQATMNDLSQSAYDSAQAGVEDAKRAIIKYQTICESDPLGASCAAALSKVNSLNCNEAVGDLVDLAPATSTNEIKVQNGTSNNLDQAYTCVTMKLNTPDFLGKLGENEYKLIPLIGDGNFNTVDIDWFNSTDLGTQTTVNLPSPGGGTIIWPLYGKSSWVSNRPPIMRTQLIQYSGSGFSLDDFNDNTGSGQSNVNTLFLYPTGLSANDSTKHFINDLRRSPTAQPTPVYCESSLTGGGYSCHARLLLPSPKNGSREAAYLYLGSLYNKANFKVVLRDGSGNIVNFKGVQPEVDSTGRANNLFRRVKSRVEMNTYFPYPTAAVVVGGNVCKEFTVTDSEEEYRPGSCTP